ncbi:MAG: hypothetical protein ACREH6_00055 [Geminicoccaceae bacterium]
MIEEREGSLNLVETIARRARDQNPRAGPPDQGHARDSGGA